ncbi:39S ribosomal protein L33, mitochondrial [Orussus abietinus]|uniref:39S ribosomal protein L33, mitochondrial n=1 Tax=Orussus abietinus TaxID=222816 RepID=UPI00062537C6|nr:39S ribosomal protein L33, mitochondrial [Orussus abietinus]
MFLTNVLLKKAKSKAIMVVMESVISGHKRTAVRERLGDKLEFVVYDPYMRMECLYRELKKIRSV